MEPYQLPKRFTSIFRRLYFYSLGIQIYFVCLTVILIVFTLNKLSTDPPNWNYNPYLNDTIPSDNNFPVPLSFNQIPWKRDYSYSTDYYDDLIERFSFLYLTKNGTVVSYKCDSVSDFHLGAQGLPYLIVNLTNNIGNYLQNMNITVSTQGKIPSQGEVFQLVTKMNPYKTGAITTFDFATVFGSQPDPPIANTQVTPLGPNIPDQLKLIGYYLVNQSITYNWVTPDEVTFSYSTRNDTLSLNIYWVKEIIRISGNPITTFFHDLPVNWIASIKPNIFNSEISFSGEIIDESGNPIKGTLISVYITVNFFNLTIKKESDTGQTGFLLSDTKFLNITSPVSLQISNILELFDSLSVTYPDLYNTFEMTTEGSILCIRYKSPFVRKLKGFHKFISPVPYKEDREFLYPGCSPKLTPIGPIRSFGANDSIIYINQNEFFYATIDPNLSETDTRGTWVFSKYERINLTVSSNGYIRRASVKNSVPEPLIGIALDSGNPGKLIKCQRSN